MAIKNYLKINSYHLSLEMSLFWMSLIGLWGFIFVYALVFMIF